MAKLTLVSADYVDARMIPADTVDVRIAVWYEGASTTGRDLPADFGRVETSRTVVATTNTVIVDNSE